MGTNDAIQIVRNAIEELSDRHQTAWNNMEIGKAQRYWDASQTLRRFLDERVNSSRRQGIWKS